MQVQFSIERKHLIGAAIAALVIVAAVGWGLYLKERGACDFRMATTETLAKQLGGELSRRRGNLLNYCDSYCRNTAQLMPVEACAHACMNQAWEGESLNPGEYE